MKNAASTSSTSSNSSNSSTGGAPVREEPGRREEHAPPPARVQTLAAVLLLLLALGLFHFGLISPIARWHAELDRRIASAQERLARYHALIEARDDWTRRLAQLRRIEKRSGLLLPGETRALAAAALQNRVQALAEGSAVDLRSLQVMAESAPEADVPAGLEPIEIKAELVADIQGLRDFLHGLEQRRPLLFLDDFSVRARLQRADPRDRSYRIHPELIVGMRIRGYRANGEREDGSAADASTGGEG